MDQGRPQKYGTQYIAIADEWKLYSVDPATTDAERAAWNVPSLSEALAQAVSMTRDRPPRRMTGLIKTLRAGGLEVDVVRVLGRLPEKPPTTPIRAGDPIPWLPPGLSPRRLPHGFGGIDQLGQLTVTWYRSSGRIVVGWDDHEGSPPELEPVDVSGRSGAWCPSRGDWHLLTLRSADGEPWILAGTCTRQNLLRVAESLP